MYDTTINQDLFYRIQTAIHIDELDDTQPLQICVVETEKVMQLARKPVYGFVKRLFDLVAGLTALFVLFVPMMFIAIWIRLDSKGPALYTQERLGLNGKPFKMFKFRSMCMDAEKDGPQWAKKTDIRVTRAGRALRKTRLDELPQLLNIIAGQMSFVGPRPERAVFYDIFDTYIHGFRQRLMIKPGLTGLAQANGGYDLRPEEKIWYDIEYMKKRSVWLDIRLILKTEQIVFNHHGAR